MSRIVLAGLAFLSSVSAANAAPFDVYRAACLDNGVDVTRIRAASQRWSALTDADREVLAPGNPSAVEGWAIVQGPARHLVSVSSSTAGGMAGDRSGAAVVSCSLLSPRSDAKATLKAYSDYLKRAPGATDTADGMATYTWSVQDKSGLSMHYLVSGASMPGLSLSVSTIRK
jgi:hypothetical protein